MDDVRALLRWGSHLGTKLDERVEIYQDSQTGLSFRAMGTIPPDTPLAISSNLTPLSYLNAIGALTFENRESSYFPSEFIAGLNDEYPHIIGNFFLMQQYLMGAGSHWYDYIRTLPQPDRPETMPTPMWWPDDDVRFLAGTNAEVAVKRKNKSWTSDYHRGFALLRERLPKVDFYTYDLYKWAATIFGTRSFRPSLTIPLSGLFEHFSPTTTRYYSLKNLKAIDHVLKDGFAVLYPILDIGNHNGENQVRWSAEQGGSFKLTTAVEIAEGCQIYNFYGHKSNSELLIGYGFILDNTNVDIVNLKIQQMANDISALTLRRSQICHQQLQRNRQPEEEWIYSISIPTDTSLSFDRPTTFKYLSEGLFDTLSCLVANAKEKAFLGAHPEYCLEKDGTALCGQMARNLMAVQSQLYHKLALDIKTFEQVDASLVSELTDNANQILALDYRFRQLQVCKKALLPLKFFLDVLHQYDSFCGHPRHSISQSQLAHNPAATLIHANVEILSLECAYEWLSQAYPEVYNPLSTFVSDLEQEPDPPRWGVLAEEFGNIYWTVWIFIAYVLEIKSENEVSRHRVLEQWLSRMNE
ncbi:SET domain-containing protein [Acephala macrosclerotiorum]|nr:SET domain-containing protein [Acephala macrosclerotiorum]